jgi:hypothetical protein
METKIQTAPHAGARAKKSFAQRVQGVGATVLFFATFCGLGITDDAPWWAMFFVVAAFAASSALFVRAHRRGILPSVFYRIDAIAEKGGAV